MRPHRFTLAALSLAAALALSSCGALGGAAGLPTVGGAVSGAVGQYAPAITNDALKAVQISLATYADVVQPAIIHYGQLPDCPGAVLCKNRATMDKLKATDAAVVQAITAAQAVLRSNIADTGQITAAVQAIKDAGAQLVFAGILSPSR